MRRATVVIGANYGDEGKGLLVDYLASTSSGPTAVVRFNGGAQAGHTVVTPEGRRHVFSHFGAGTLAGADTYLAKHFVCNPLLFWKEARTLSDLGHQPQTIAADPRCFLTTPYDMLVNQAIEDARGDKRHGSVGVGFGETIERNQYPAFQLWKSDLADRDKVTGKLRLIRDKWLLHRTHQLQLPRFQKDDSRLTDEMLDKTVEAFCAFEAAVGTAGAEFLERKSVIFEGAQGLALDMGSENFPHVTRSNTGLTNVLPIARALGLLLDVVHVTRPYLTKHGAGPLPEEREPDPRWTDETNTAHPYQGTLRFAPLNVTEMLARIDADRALDRMGRYSVAMTCTDQVSQALVAELCSRIGDVSIRSAGPRRDNVSGSLRE